MESLKEFIEKSGISKLRRKRRFNCLREGMIPSGFTVDTMHEHEQDERLPQLPRFGDISDEGYDDENPVKRAIILTISSGDKPPTNPNTGQPYKNFHDEVDHYLKNVMGEDPATSQEIKEILSDLFSEVGEVSKERNKSDVLAKVSYDYEKKLANYEPESLEIEDEDDFWG